MPNVSCSPAIWYACHICGAIGDLVELDAAVNAWVESLVRKLPQTTRYANQQLNVWRDLAWHQTVGHARDWLALSMLSDETQGAVRSFLESRKSR